jgi:hypothetical protein
MSWELGSMSKDPPSIGVDEKSADYSTSTSCSILNSTFVVFFYMLFFFRIINYKECKCRR